jgi:hypothetical protein
MGGGQFFVIGSSIGYVLSAVYFFLGQLNQSFLAFDQYPELMRLHLAMNFPLERFERMKLDQQNRLKERQRLRDSWKLSSMVVASYQTASSSIDVCMLCFSPRLTRLGNHCS